MVSLLAPPQLFYTRCLTHLENLLTALELAISLFPCCYHLIQGTISLLQVTQSSNPLTHNLSGFLQYVNHNVISTICSNHDWQCNLLYETLHWFLLVSRPNFFHIYISLQTLKSLNSSLSYSSHFYSWHQALLAAFQWMQHTTIYHGCYFFLSNPMPGEIIFCLYLFDKCLSSHVSPSWPS